MAKAKATMVGGAPKKRHHRLKKLVKLAAVVGAIYGAKKLWDQKQRRAK